MARRQARVAVTSIAVAIYDAATPEDADRAFRAEIGRIIAPAPPDSPAR